MLQRNKSNYHLWCSAKFIVSILNNSMIPTVQHAKFIIFNWSILRQINQLTVFYYILTQEYTCGQLLNFIKSQFSIGIVKESFMKKKTLVNTFKIILYISRPFK